MVQADPLNVAFMEQIKGPWTQILKFAQLNKVRAQKMQQAEIRRRAEEEAQMNTDMMEQQRKDIVAEREQSRKDMESQGKMERAKEQSQTRADIMREGVRVKGENERMAARMKAENDRIVKKPQEILQDVSTEEMQANLRNIGQTPNPIDFK